MNTRPQIQLRTRSNKRAPALHDHNPLPQPCSVPLSNPDLPAKSSETLKLKFCIPLTPSASTSRSPGPNTTQAPDPKRDIHLRWSTDQEVARHSSLEKNTFKVLSEMGAISIHILHNPQDFISSFLSSIETLIQEDSGTPSLSTPSTPSHSNGLGIIAHRIAKCEEKGVGLDFELAINLIHFIIKLEHLQEVTQQEFTSDVLRLEVDTLKGFTLTKGRRWKEYGYKLAAFAGAGV